MRNVVLPHSIHGSLHVIEVSVTPPAQLEAQCPVRNHGGQTDSVVVLLQNVLRARTEENVNVEHASDGSESQRRIGHQHHI